MKLPRSPIPAPAPMVARELRATLQSVRGAFDLPSILVGVVVVGVLTAGVLAAIFGVIPFAQDNGATQDLAALRTAEGVARAKDGRFMDRAELEAAGYVSAPAATAGSSTSGGGFERAAAVTSEMSYTVETNEPGTCYLSISRSGSGTLFYSTDTDTEPQILTPTTAAGCLSGTQTQTIVDGLGGFGSKYVPSAPSGLAGTIQSPTVARFSWSATEWASGYKIEYRINGGTWITQNESQTATTTTVTATQGDTVDIRVTALNAAGASAPATGSTALPSLPGAPANLISTTATPTAGTFTWDAVATATGYNVETRINGGTWTVHNVNQTGTSAVINASGPATIDIRVTAINPAGTSSSNATASVNLPAPPPDFTKPASWTAGTSLGNNLWGASSMSADGTRLTAGSTAHIYSSSDSGATWTARITGTWTSLASSADGLKVLATDNSGYVVTSTDGGATWTQRLTSVGSGGWSSAASSADGTRLMVSRSTTGMVYTSTDSGSSWTQRTVPGIGNSIVAIASSADGMKLVVGRSGNYLYTSTDGGANWTARTSAGTGNWYTASSSDDGTKLIAGKSDGSIYNSTDSGATWTARPAVGTTWYASASSADGTKVIIGGQSGVFTSADSGATWIKQTMGGTSRSMSVSISNDGTRMLVSRYGESLYVGTVGS